jgi:outer membrane receptor protein involved in Fe transport
MKKNWAASHYVLAPAVCVVGLGLAASQAGAQEPAGQSTQAVEEVTVTGTRLVTSGVNTPTPVTSLTSVDLQKMAPTTLIESLSQLPVFDNNIGSQQAVGGAVAPGGANLNLRGLDAPRTLVLLDGRRLGPSNKYGTVDVGVVPETLVRSVEAVTGGASAAYGADAVAGVVNFRLDRKLDGFKTAASVGTTTYSDDEQYKLGIGYGTDVGQKGHIIAAVETWHKKGIDDFSSLQDRSDFIQLRSQVTNPDPVNGPNFLMRPYVSPTNFTAGGIILAPAMAATPTTPALPLSTVLDHVEFLPGGGGAYQKLPFSGVGVLTGGCACQARPTLEYGVNSDFEVDTPADRGVLFAHYDHTINDRNTFFVETLLADTQQQNRWQTAALVTLWQARLYADNPYLPAAIRQQLQTEGRPFVGFGIFTPNLPGNPFEDGQLIAKNRYGQVTGGYTHNLSDNFLAGNWALDTWVQYAQNRQETVDPGGMRTDRLFLSMDAVTDTRPGSPTNGQPVCRVTLFNPGIFDSCVPINLIGGTASVTPAAAHYVVDDGKIARGRVTEEDAEVSIRGDLTKGSGGVLGSISAAAGVSWREEQLGVRTLDPCDEFPCTIEGQLMSDLGLAVPGSRGITASVNPTTGLPQFGVPGLRFVPSGFAGDANSSTVLFSSQRTVEGGYSVREAFAEFGIPLLKNGRLNLDEAIRGVWYTGSGNEQPWKSGVSFQVTPRFRLRATESKDVRAPTLRERFESQRGGVNVQDPAFNNTTIATANYTGGNPDVGLEVARTSVYGFVYQPTDKFSVTVDKYDINIDQAIGQLTAQQEVNACYNSAGHNSSSLCQYVIRDSNSQIVRVDSLFINLSNLRVKGYDIEFNYSGIQLGSGNLSWRFLGTRLDENSVLTPGSPRDDRAGDVGSPAPAGGLPKNKFTTYLTWARGPISIFLQERYIGSGVNDHTKVESTTRFVATPGVPSIVTASVDENDVASVLYTDLTFNFAGRKTSNTHWETFLTVNNLTNEAPPAQYPGIGRTGVPGPNTTLYDTIGRRYMVGLRLNF